MIREGFFEYSSTFDLFQPFQPFQGVVLFTRSTSYYEFTSTVVRSYLVQVTSYNVYDTSTTNDEHTRITRKIPTPEP